MLSLSDRIHEIAAGQSGAIAVFDGAPCTWREIMSISPDLSAFAGGVVAVVPPKGRRWISILIACLRDGVTFCPIDPNGAPERIEHILDTVQAQVIFRDTTTEYTRLPISGDNQSAAYLIFTSDSTGTPKGVLVGEKGVHNVIDSQIELYEATNSRFVWLLNPGFDASLSDVFCGLLGGGTLFIPDFPITHRKKLIAYFQEHDITHADFPPVMLGILELEDFPCLKVVVTGGEPIAPAAAQRWTKRVKVFNAYGPTETTICSSSIRIHHLWLRPWLGEWFRGVEPFVLVEGRVLAVDAIGDSIGELLLTGDNLAIDYFKMPVLTASRFVVLNGVRYYKTGDLVGRGKRGLYYAGRTDRQTKVNGCLVCPEEIEGHIRVKWPTSAIKIVEGEIIAYTDATVSLSELREYLSSKVPRYMLPHRLYQLAQMPVNAHGKIDYSKL